MLRKLVINIQFTATYAIAGMSTPGAL